MHEQDNKEEGLRCYKIEKVGRNWMLALYCFYPHIPKPEFGRGPYCISRKPIRGKDIKRYHSAAKAQGIIPLDEAKTMEE